MHLHEYVLDLRNRLISQPGFRKRIQKTPIFQYFARREANRLFALCAGFVHSQVLFACVRSGLIDALRSRPLPLAELARQSNYPLRRLERLLEAGVAIDLFVRLRDERFGLGGMGAALCDNPGVRAMILHHCALYEDLADPQTLMADADFCGQSRQYWAYANGGVAAELGEQDVAAYSDLMSASQDLFADEVLAVAPFANSKALLEVGGGDGSFAIAAAKRWPRLGITVADLPAVVERASKRIRDAGMAQRIRTVGLDFHQEPLPSGHDHISLLRILHDHDDGPVERLLAAVNRALIPGGRLLIAEPLAEDTRTGRLLQSYFSMYLLSMGQGRLRTPAELGRMLERAGFASVKRPSSRMPLVTSVLTALKT